MTSAILVVALVVGVRAQDQRDGATVPAPAQQRQTTLLESATTLVMSTPQPTFHVDVDARFPRQTPLDALREELAAD